MVGLAGERGQTAHERATNAEDMNMHRVILGGPTLLAGRPKLSLAAWARASRQNASMQVDRTGPTAEIAAVAARLVVEEGLAPATGGRGNVMDDVGL